MLLGAVGGLALSWWWLRDRVRPAVVAGVLALAAFCVLAASGLPILGRYLLLPAAIGAILCGAGAFGWRSLPEGDRRRRPWAWFGVATLVALARVRARPDRRASATCATRCASRTGSRTTCGRSSASRRARCAAGCTPVGVPNHRPIPLLALWLDVRPARVVSLQERDDRPRRLRPPGDRPGRRATTCSTRATCDKAIPPPPPGFRLAAANRSWRVFQRCRPR